MLVRNFTNSRPEIFLTPCLLRTGLRTVLIGRNDSKVLGGKIEKVGAKLQIITCPIRTGLRTVLIRRNDSEVLGGKSEKLVAKLKIITQLKRRFSIAWTVYAESVHQ